MIIGAFSMGLALSGTELAHRLDEPLKAVYAALVPVFFVVMGMLVNVTSLGSVWQFGLVLTGFAVLGKVAGSGLPALLAGFNRRGAWRIGVGMLPRGEVALIMAGIGISKGVLGQDLYGVSIMMTIITTALAPPLLAVLFRSGGSGVRTKPSAQEA
jgi:Kef-type K+ transport system membrane component KefB